MSEALVYVFQVAVMSGVAVGVDVLELIGFTLSVGGGVERVAIFTFKVLI